MKDNDTQNLNKGAYHKNLLIMRNRSSYGKAVLDDASKWRWCYQTTVIQSPDERGSQVESVLLTVRSKSNGHSQSKRFDGGKFSRFVLSRIL